jgi:pyruvate dehydrogenase E2 component (dihydrolipoamide acetyltransferase)
MPRQGQSVETCIMGQWYKETGEEVRTGELLFSYETDKATFDEEAKADGILLVRFFEAGEEVPVLTEIGFIGETGEKVETKAQAQAEVQGKDTEENSGDETPKVIEFSVEPGLLSAERIAISPLARNIARQLGIDVTGITGTGPQGRIIARDIEAVARLSSSGIGQSARPEKSDTPAEKVRTDRNVLSVQRKTADFEIKPLSNMRKLIAKAMHASLQNSAQLTHHLSADARNLLAARKKFKSDFESGKSGDNITINDLVCFAVIRALKSFPLVNAHFLGDQLKYFSKVHLGLAIDTDRGLMVPSLRNADDFSISGLSARLRQLATECRKGNINPDLLNPEAASFTISNLGNYGVEMFTPVINLPQTAILGVCAIVPRPVDIGDGVYAIVPVIGLSLTYDHRALDGGEATRFLAEIRNQIETINL